MPLAYSTDLRWRVVWLHIAHSLKVSDIAEQLCRSERSVRRYIGLFQRSGDVKPCSQQHGPPKLLGEFEQVLLLRLIINNLGIYLHEIQQEWIARFGVNVSVATFCKTLKYMGCTRQVMRHVALQQSDEQRARSFYGRSVHIWSFHVNMDWWEWVRLSTQ